MDRLWADGIDLRVVLQGAFGSGDLERAVAPWLGHSRVERHEFLSEPEFLDLARSLDVCLNLRYPTACETSGIAITLMGLGKTVVFTDGPEISRYPEGSCLRVPAGPEEEPALHRLLSALDANLCAEIGRRAARHIHENHAPAACAEAYWRILRIVHLGGSQ